MARLLLRPALGLTLAALIALATACPDLPEVFRLAGSSAADGGPGDAQGVDRLQPDAVVDGGVDAGCGPGTPGYGEPCGEDIPPCGVYVCDMSDQLICYDPGQNACGVCGELDESAGKLGEDCGTCGVVTCNVDGTATICSGEHPRNVCGGCGAIAAIDAGSPDAYHRGPPGAVCSSCGTGRWRCTADQNDLACYRGRGVTSCGDCQRCVLYHAAMDQRHGGAFVRAGTMALVEDTGTDVDVGSDATRDTTRSLSFDPLLAGPAASGLAQAEVWLSPTNSPYAGIPLTPYFSASLLGEPADVVRRYVVNSWIDLEYYSYVIIYDWFFEDIISLGLLVAGPPAVVPENDAGVGDAARPDAANPDAENPDAAPTDSASPDAAQPDTSSGDAGIEDVPSGDGASTDLGGEDRVEDSAVPD
ncbi:MAG: hypothetical protein JXR83_14340 [Deltaproteobacteria bacterium]|nr:hypothetical protein [Deltaproteobacteria bacterium]